MKYTGSTALKNYCIPLVVMAAVGLAILGNAPQRLPYSPEGNLSQAAFEGNLGEAQTLIQKGADVNARDKGAPGWTPLHFAAAMGHVPVVELLIGKGADVNIRDSQGNTPLHATGKMVAGNKSVGILIKKGANVNAVNKEGKTLLQEFINEHTYIESPSIDVLLEAGADPAIVDKSGHSAYMDSRRWTPELSLKLERYMKIKK